MPTRLFHFTCAHAAPRIVHDGVVIPYPQPMLGGVALSWWTTSSRPEAVALGLAGRSLVKCDRMEFRFRADVDDVVPWTLARVDFPAGAVHRLEAARGARPSLWFVATEPVRVDPAPMARL